MVAAIVLNPTHAKVGASVLITGSGFHAGDTMSFTYGGSPIVPTEAPIVVAGDGTLPTCHIVIPASVFGVHVVAATDQTLNTATANFTTDPGVSLSPSTQRIGGSTTVTGTGFATLSAVTITIGGTPVTGVTTDVLGNFSIAETVPTLASGAQTVSCTDAATNNGTATLTVSAPTLVRSPTSGPVGTVVTLTGANYIPNQALTITNTDGSTSASTADSSGNIPAGVTVTIPDATHGNHNITCSDGTNTGTAVFAVTSSLVLAPTSGRIGSTFTVTAKGLATNSAVTVDFAGTSVTPGGSPTSNAAGTYVGTITVPTKASGARTVTVTDASANAPTATYTVSAPTLALSPTSGPVGTVTTLTGANYVPSATLTITNVDGTTTTVTADASGNIPAATTIAIETSPQGSNNVTVSDATNTGTATFSITPLIVLDPTSGISTEEVRITGTGFAGTSVTGIQIDGVTVVTSPSTITTDDDGAFVATTTLASLANGSHTFLATDASANTSSATFTVSATDVFKSITNDLNVQRVYKWLQELEIVADDNSYADAAVIDTRNIANILMTINNKEASNGLTFATLGIIHESDNTVPPTDAAGIKKWSAIDTDVSVAAGTTANKLYQNILWSYILVRVKRTTSGQDAVGLFSAKTIDKNG